MKKILYDRQLSVRRLALALIDIIAINLSVYIALAMRFESVFKKIPTEYIMNATNYGIVHVILTLIIFWVFRLYHSLWMYASIKEYISIIFSCVTATVVHFAGSNLFQMPLPKSVYIMEFMLLLCLTMASRFFYRIARVIRGELTKNEERVNVLLIGGGDAGRMLLNEMKQSRMQKYCVQCIIDDNKEKRGTYMMGVKIVGGRYMIKTAVEKYDIGLIIIAIPSAGVKVCREIFEMCKELPCEIRILPGVYQMVNGEVSMNQLRRIEIEDLLGRDSVKMDIADAIKYISGKTVMVTGGGGSIGSELCRQIARCGPKQLIIVDIYENNAYDIQQELIKNYPSLDLKVLIASVRDAIRMREIFEDYRPEFIYHAAAHKHVPLMEESPKEAIKNNVFGTLNMAKLANEYNVKRFLLVSTDKAVNPTNIMGASKRMCEMIIQTFNTHSETEFVAVRFGNVLGSNGSVIPLFQKQIREGGPVTVTHPDIIRYFMTIPEAVSLILQAGTFAKGGEIFVLDMGDPVRIVDLAENMIRLSGLKVGTDIEIVYTGLRPGEKLYEELLMGEEGLKETENKLIHIGKPIEIDESAFYLKLKHLKEVIDQKDVNIRSLVHDIVPTYLMPDDKEKHAS